MSQALDSVPCQPAADDVEVARLQKQLAYRLLLVFLIPFGVLVVSGVYSWRLSARLSEVELLERMSNVERLWSRSKNYEWAIEEYKQLATVYRRPEVLVRLGALLFQGGNRDEALQVLNEAQRIDERYWEIYTTLSYIYLADTDEQNAVAAGERAIRLNKNDAQSYNNLAWIYATTNRPDLRNTQKAKDYALKAVKLTHMQDPDYLDTLAETYFRSGDHGDAVATIERAIANELSRVRYLEKQLIKFKSVVSGAANRVE
jgi:tetratricopeptide (TPR) repeat protein